MIDRSKLVVYLLGKFKARLREAGHQKGMVGLITQNEVRI